MYEREFPKHKGLETVFRFNRDRARHSSKHKPKKCQTRFNLNRPGLCSIGHSKHPVNTMISSGESGSLGLWISNFTLKASTDVLILFMPM